MPIRPEHLVDSDTLGFDSGASQVQVSCAESSQSRAPRRGKVSVGPVWTTHVSNRQLRCVDLLVRLDAQTLRHSGEGVSSADHFLLEAEPIE